MFVSINGGKLPERATKYSAGFDVFANEDVIVGAGCTEIVGLGVALDLYIEDGDMAEISNDNYIDCSMHYFALHIRSSLRAKGLTSLGIGIIDIDYKDEIKMIIHNPLRWGEVMFDIENKIYTKGVQHNASYVIKKGDKIGQLILCRHNGWLLPKKYTKDEERRGGFGSTGM